MNAGVFDALTRRASLATVGAAGLAALANPITSAGKKKKKKKKGDVNKLCKEQASDCITTLTPSCMGDPDCLAAVQLCCPELATCDAAGFLACIVANA